MGSMAMRKVLSALFAAVISASLAPPASATNILFGSGEDSGYTAFGTVGVYTSGGFRSAWAREALSIPASASDPPANRWATPTFISSSALWFHAQLFSGFASSVLNDQALLFRSPDGVSRLFLRQTSTAGQLKLSTANAARTFTDLATSTITLAPNTLNAIDLQINYTCSGSGAVNLWINGVQGIAFTGNPCTDSATQLNEAELGPENNGTIVNCGTNQTSCWSEVIIADGSTLGMGLLTDPPVAAGATQSCVPNTVSNINPATINDANNISTTSTSAICEFTIPTTIPTGTWGIVAITQDVRAVIGTTGPQHFNLVSHVSGSDFTNGSFAPITSYTNFNGVWANNPNTSAPWALSDISGGTTQFGIKSAP